MSGINLDQLQGLRNLVKGASQEEEALKTVKELEDEAATIEATIDVEEEAPEPEPVMSIVDVMGYKPPPPLIEIEEPKKDPSSLSPYEIWQSDPTPTNLYAVTKSLKPTIDSVLAGSQSGGNPQVAAKARVITAKAIESYDPSQGTSLPTWVSSQLRQLNREVRKSNNIISIPEGVQLDAYAISRKEAEFIDENDREPTVEELADLTHMSVKRITKVREKMRPVANESSYNNEENSLLQGGASDFSKDSLDYVYNNPENNTTDKKILEYLLGYGGATQLEPKEIMQKLKLSPVQYTRKKARLILQLQEGMANLAAIQ